MYSHTNIRTILTSLNPSELDFHAPRYYSAQMYQNLIQDLRDGMSASSDDICATVLLIASECENDGADFGHIPCLGGTPASIFALALDMAMCAEGV